MKLRTNFVIFAIATHEISVFAIQFLILAFKMLYVFKAETFSFAMVILDGNIYL